MSVSPNAKYVNPLLDNWSATQVEPRRNLERSVSEEFLLFSDKIYSRPFEESRKAKSDIRPSESPTLPASISTNPADRSHSPPLLTKREAVNRAVTLSQKLSVSNIPTHVTETGDLMLDMTGYKSSEDDALRAEIVARKILAEELEGSYDIGSLIGADEHGNLWIYSSEEAKEAAARKSGLLGLGSVSALDDTISDPGYSEEEHLTTNSALPGSQQRQKPAIASNGLNTPPQTPLEIPSAGDPNRNYAKTLRLTSGQLQGLKLKPGPNLMSFSVNRATCQAYMYYWAYNVPVVISDIDGTITK